MAPRSKRSKATKKRTDKDQSQSSSELPGWPGYRTRAGRSGYDPIDTRAEAGHTAGTLIRTLFYGDVQNPIPLLLLGILGLVLVAPLILAISELWNGNVFPWSAWIFLLLAGIAGIVILINFTKNLIRIMNR